MKIRQRVAVTLAAVALCSIAVAQEQGARLPFDIQPQPISRALADFGKQAGVQVLVRTEDIKNGQALSPAVNGQLTARAALEQLLANSGLTYEYLDERTIRVRPVTQPPLAQAQSRPRGTEEAANPGANNQKSAANEAALEEIIVTAQKREERLQDVPISVSVLGGGDLEASGARGIGDALNQVGGVNLIENQPGASTIAIRGASAGGPFNTGSAPVGYYLDEVPFSFISHAILPDANAFDLERVEVLRGPQGTLYGASSLNGVVRILTNKADLNELQFKGRLRAGVTESADNTYMGDMAVNVPLVEGKLAVRAVASYADYGGFITSTCSIAPSSSCPTPKVTKNFNSGTVQSYRLKVDAAPVENLKIDFGYWASRIENDGPSEGQSNLQTQFSADQPNGYKYDSYNLNLNYDFGAISLLSATGLIDLKSHQHLDYMYADPFLLMVRPDVLRTEFDSKNFSQELRLTSNFDGPWQVTGGALYRTIDERLYQNPEAFLVFGGIPSTVSNKSKSYAVFSELTRALMDNKLKLTGGLRYFKDTLTTNELSSPFAGPPGFAPLMHKQTDFNAVTWRLAAAYEPIQTLTLYASAATGFRSGLNQSPAALASSNGAPLPTDVDADRLTSIEVGAKGTVGEGHVYYDAAVYHMTWKDSQQTLFSVTGAPYVVNAEPASGYGISANIIAKLTDGLSVNASGDWNNLEFDEAVLQPVAGPPGSTVVLFPKGSRLNNSPKLTASLGAEYRFPIGNDLKAFFAANGRYNSKMIRYDLVNVTPTKTESDNIVYGEVRAGVEARHWTTTLFVDNVTNENGGVVATTSLVPTEARLRPRTYGLQLSFSY